MRTSENAEQAKFAEFVKAEVGLPRRGTMMPAIGQEEAKVSGFLEEAPARPSG